MTLTPRAVLVHRRSEYAELLARHATREQAAFFLRSRGRDLAEVARRDEALRTALQQVAASVPDRWRRAEVERADLAAFLFAPEDVVLVVGPDGLVANVAKYLDGQPVIGVDPEPGRNPGVLVPFHAKHAGRVLAATTAGAAAVQERTMVEAVTDDGRVLRALNEVYVGHASHQSSRYLLDGGGGAPEHQSSSGVLVGTGTGATGWLWSAWHERHSALALPGPTDAALAWFVREAWASPATGAGRTEGVLAAGEALAVVAETDALVCFGDGIESDALTLTWGQRLEVHRSATSLRLVVP